MGKFNLTQIANSVRQTLVKHSPEILTGIGVAGMVATTILAVQATPKALKLIEQRKEEEHVDKLTPLETVQTCWKCYIPAAISGVASAACVIGASSVNARRNAALAAAYTLSETALKEYKEKVIETVGEKKERAVRDAVSKERIEQNPVGKNEIIVTGKGNSLCYDSISGRYFNSDIDKINKAVNKLNADMINNIFGYVSLNEFYDELGLAPTQLGDDLGWNLGNGEGLIKVNFSAQLSENEQPCIVLDYDVAPKYGYSVYN